ncbi:TetR/AcrR family transcriptional regulator [Shouchella clausii]
MPKFVDSSMQKERIAEAAWRVIQREGLEKASVRNIANEAGISPGVVQHNFKTQSQLLEFSMQRVVQRVSQRIEESNLAMPDISLHSAEALLLNLLPIDEERELEAEVWLALTLKALHEPVLQNIGTETYSAMQQMMKMLLTQLHEVGNLKQGLDLEQEAIKLQLLLDGLTLHLMINPDVMTKQKMRTILHQHMMSLSNS